MPDAPVDLSKLPCPQGCRWEYRGIEAIQYVLLCGDVWLGRVWHRHGETEWRAEGDGYRRYAVTNRLEDGINALFHALGLTPAPAPDSADAELRAHLIACGIDGFVDLNGNTGERQLHNMCVEAGNRAAKAEARVKELLAKLREKGRTFTEAEVRAAVYHALRNNDRIPMDQIVDAALAAAKGART